jgi:hypothetical protein
MRRYNHLHITKILKKDTQMGTLTRIGITFLFGLLSISTAFAQQTAIDGVGFKLGDDVQTVKAALKTEFRSQR